ncbi:hypothetical protein Goarm_022498 [Gossypium armourianum]|uniref:Uncharacterized protein n=1 Tax=Gossypium armourianum TaxID=34283 RepID=A0A7J9KHQ5_9ROSI|nr:hypothetical protein [Gossypium armourianum]
MRNYAYFWVKRNTVIHIYMISSKHMENNVEGTLLGIYSDFLVYIQFERLLWMVLESLSYPNFPFRLQAFSGVGLSWCLVKMHGSSKKMRKSKDQVVREETHTYVISYPTWGASLHMVCETLFLS